MQHRLECLFSHHVRSRCLIDHLRAEQEGDCSCLLLIHLPDYLHHRRSEQRRRQPVVRHQIDQGGVEVSNVSGLPLDRPRQGQQVELVLLPTQVIVQVLNILLESRKTGSLNFHGIWNILACERAPPAAGEGTFQRRWPR